jgi:aspartyl-tRNA(Asn)/glutamyl-tRNA(Gln) amidotransferase subunit C
LAGELSNIMQFVEQLAEVDTEGVAPMTSVAHMELPRRDDRVTDGDCPDLVLANAPERHDGFFVVPKVVE